MPGYGMTTHIGMSFQESYGTPYAANSVDYIPFISESITKTVERLSVEGMTGIFDEGGHYEGLNSIEGDITFEVHPVLAGKMLKAFCNNASGTLVGSVYTHTFNPVHTDFDQFAAVPPCTLEVHRDVGSSFQYSDMCLNTLSIEFANGALTRATAGFMGGKFAWMAKTAPSYIVGSYFPWDVTSVSLGGNAVSRFSQFTITLNNNLENKHTLNGTKTPSYTKRTGFRTVEISGTVLFDNDTDARQFMNQTAQTLVLTATGASLTTSQSHVFKLDIPRFHFTDMPVNAGGPGMIEVSFGGVAKYDTGSGTVIKATMVNTYASY